jgi:hypothetical protein
MVLLLENEFPKMVFVAENVLPKIVFVAESLLPKIVFVAANLLPKMLLFADRPLPSLQSAVTLKLLLLEPSAEKASEGMADEMLWRNQKNWNTHVSAVAQLTTPLLRVSDSPQHLPSCTLRNEAAIRWGRCRGAGQQRGHQANAEGQPLADDRRKRPCHARERIYYWMTKSHK